MIDERFPNWEIDVENGTVYNLKLKHYVGSVGKNGYMSVASPRGYKHRGVHQYIWMVANGCDIPNGYHIHHIDGNPLNNSIYNLELIDEKTHLSEHSRINKNFKGKHHNELTKLKIINKLKGRHLTEEHKNNISKGNINNPNFSKKVCQYTLDGELVKIWDSMNEAERNGFNHTNICQCCKGQKKTHKGFIWEYYEEQKDVA